jgi:hypothetical protein
MTQITSCPACNGVGFLLFDCYGRPKATADGWHLVSMSTHDYLDTCPKCDGYGLIGELPAGQKRMFEKRIDDTGTEVIIRLGRGCDE